MTSTLDFLFQLAVVAVVIQFATRVVSGVKPPLSMAFIAVSCACVIGLVIGLILFWFGFGSSSMTVFVLSQLFQIFVGGLFTYSWIFRNPAKEPIGIRKGAQVAGIEVLVRIVLMALMFGLFSAVHEARYDASPMPTPPPATTP